MNFKKKLFLAILIPSVIICGALLVVAHLKASSSLKTEFTSRYEAVNGVLARSLVQIQENTDRSMMNAARLFQRHEAEYPGIGTPGLKKLSSDIGAANVFVADSNGKFVRATNDAAADMPNLLSVCSGYGSLFGRAHAFETTPITSSAADGLPYKYMIVPNTAGNRFLEVAYQVDFIEKTLADAIGADKGIQKISLYSAEGASLGEFGPEAAKAGTARAPLAWNGKEGVQFDGDRATFTKLIPLSDANCCECKVLKAKNKSGYAYVLQTTVSAVVLAEAQAQLRSAMGVASAIAVGVALLLSLLISHFLVARLNKLRNAINGISSSAQVTNRVGGEGKDEIGALASAFNRMLERMENSHAKFLRTEKAKLALSMTSQVANDIRSPLAAFNVLETDLADIPRECVQLLRSAINRVRDIANNLVNQRPELDDEAGTPENEMPRVKLVSYLLEPIVSETRALARPGVKIECGLDAKSYGWFAYLQASEFQRAIANLVKQAVESVDGIGRVRLELSRVDHELMITVTDDGADATDETKRETFESELKQARTSLEAWGGRLEVQTTADGGTERRILLPMAEAPFWFVDRIEVPSNTTLVVVDDDPSVHHVWQRTFDAHMLAKNDCSLVRLSSPEELDQWIAANAKKLRQSRFFVDYEYVNAVENGLELIERHSIQSRSVLVTNRFDERSVLEVCARLRVRMIPKTMLGFVPVEASLEWRSPERIANQSTTLEI